MELAEPSLAAPSSRGDEAVLLALRDPRNGALAFPRTPYGIGTTGLPTEASEPVELCGRAYVVACVTVYQALSPGLPVPMLVARLRLEEGIVVDGVVEGSDELAVGTPVQAVLVKEVRDGRDLLVCKFRAVRGGE